MVACRQQPPGLSPHTTLPTSCRPTSRELCIGRRSPHPRDSMMPMTRGRVAEQPGACVRMPGDAAVNTRCTVARTSSVTRHRWGWGGYAPPASCLRAAAHTYALPVLCSYYSSQTYVALAACGGSQVCSSHLRTWRTTAASSGAPRSRVFALRARGARAPCRLGVHWVLPIGGPRRSSVCVAHTHVASEYRLG